MTTLDNIAFSIFNNKGIYALMLGSGISKNSGVPTGWDICLDLIKKVGKLGGEDIVDPHSWYIEKYGEEPDYSVLLEKLGKTPSERVNILRPYFESSEQDLLNEPSIAHRSIAKLVKRGYFKVIITTNFDRLIEKALRDENIEPQVIKHSSDIEGATPLVHSRMTLIKVNGDYLDNRFLNTKKELETYDSHLDNFIIDIINNFGLISCGWSGIWDTGLVNAIRRSNNFRYNNYWTYVNNNPLELEEIAQFRKGSTLKIQSADNFFSEMLERIDAIESGNLNDPLTVDIAIARAKKYLAKEEYNIQLADLLLSETKKIEVVIESNFSPSMLPSPENLSPILDNYSSALRSYLPLILLTTVWSKESHIDLIVNILQRLCKPIMVSGGSYTDTKKFKYIPALMVFYCIGIVSIKLKKYRLLDKIFRTKISDESGSKSKIFIIEILNPQMIDKEILRKILKMNYHTPLSTMVNKNIRDYFTDIIFDDIDYQDTFDLFEYFISLNYLFFVGKRHGHDWAPWGEFQWRKRDHFYRDDYPIYDFLKDVDLLKSDLDILNAGMFDRSINNLYDIKTRLEEFLQQIHLY